MEFDFRVVHKIIPINTLSGKKSKWRDIQSHNRTKADMLFKVGSDFIRYCNQNDAYSATVGPPLTVKSRAVACLS